ncbi:MAG: GNAT family N-acetyltransferase [Thaumarchaeota archaeon]|nr:GNAT family N-acetyltransferase [Nitrososphaerota archaeon]
MDFEIKPLTDFKELRTLDFMDDGSDPLGVHNFAQVKAQSYGRNNLSVIWGVRSDRGLIGFFSISMSSIQTKKLEPVEHVPDAPTIYSYPVVLLGQLGVDREQRHQGIGSMMIKFCVGLAQELSGRIGCRYVVLQTSQNRTNLYHNLRFVQSSKPPTDHKVWMYRKLA